MLYKKAKRLDFELGQSINNVRSYENTIAGLKDRNTVLQLNIADLRNSNDRLIHSLDSTRKALKIKDKELSLAAHVETIIRDTTVIELPVKTSCDFEIVIQKHPWSKYEISRKDNTLVHIPTVLNHQDLFVINRKVWRNPGKNFFQRLFSLDFKKDKVQQYQIINANPDIEVTDTRVVKLTE